LDRHRLIERRPRLPLRHRVVSVWTLEIADGEPPYEQLDIPHGGADLVCVLGSQLVLHGPRPDSKVVEFGPGSSIVGIRLNPSAGLALRAVTPLEVFGQTVDAADVWGKDARSVDELLVAEPDVSSAAAALERWAERVLDLETSGDVEVDALVHACIAGARNIRSARAGLPLSERQLRRRCEDVTGQSPRELLRVVRFQRFVALAQQRVAAGTTTNEGFLAAMAMRCGYADHAHLTRECRHFSGMPPAKLLARTTGLCTHRHDHRASFERFTL
jgi:AraC-like DNA-binding protein